jgi:hypothetical protein
MLLVGTVMGVSLGLLGAPLWSYYVVPSLVATPLLLWEFSRINSRDRRREEEEAARHPSPRNEAHRVAGA